MAKCERGGEKDLLLIAAGDVVAESQQGVHEVDILGIYVLRHGDLHIGEVPEAPDAQRHQSVSQRLRHVLRHRQHRHGGVMLR